MYYWMYQDSEKVWRWTLYVANNSRIADSSVGYRDKQECQNAIDRVKASGNAVVKDGASEQAERDESSGRRRKLSRTA
jgi:uncharacterized protein YegP (UPF0339 family)